MVTLDVLPIAGAADTNAHGEAVHGALRATLDQHQVVAPSFAGLSTATSSFVNSAIVPVLLSLGIDEFKVRVRITKSTRQINDLIRDRCIREAGRPLRAA